jgi:hypothetical protein
MQINKRITLIKYLNNSNLSIYDFEQIQTVYTLSNSNYLIWNRNSFEFGEEQDFLSFEYGKSYIIVSASGANYTIETGVSDTLDSVTITNTRQADIYKGSSAEIQNYGNIQTAYKVSDNGEFWNIWNRNSFEFGEEQDFNSFVDDGVYLIISSSVPYSLWSSTGSEVYELTTEAGETLMTEDNYLLVV